MDGKLRIKRQRERELNKLAKQMFGREYNALSYDDTQKVEIEYGNRILVEVRAKE